MPIQKGADKGEQRRREGKYTPNTQQNKQVEDAMKAANVPVTPENKETVHRKISGQELTYKELVIFIKNLFDE